MDISGSLGHDTCLLVESGSAETHQAGVCDVVLADRGDDVADGPEPVNVRGSHHVIPLGLADREEAWLFSVSGGNCNVLQDLG
ncbi:hypothetical protein [Nonomuraea sp. 10N515B]|uniref:hypothetical protein n=1 Tax=Nonomuraea sp. 10N515B TaxID=3457422 RepID=UPI003FCD194A